MLVIKPYLRERAVEYAARYAFSQNPLFGNFRGIGGNCTNFVSQAIYSASCVMNYTPTFGWYYVSMDDRSPSWSGVDYFYNFFVSNRAEGPFASDVSLDQTEIGDVIQLANNEEGFYHTLPHRLTTHICAHFQPTPTITRDIFTLRACAWIFPTPLTALEEYWQASH